MTAAQGNLVGDRYRLLRQLGAGGMGVVWEARDERLDRLVAVKQLRTQPGLPPEETEVAGERAMREARITARLHHPHAVAVFDVVEHDGSPCIVMELVPSVPLTETLRVRNVITPTEAGLIGSQIAGALAAAHALGIVHRDVKPGNVLMGHDGQARICDFGISRAYGDSTLTMTGMITGTPAFLAPEVARGEDSTSASDVYSLGATLYAAVEGRPPSGTEGTPIAVLYRVAAGQVQPPQRAGVLGNLLLAMLAADPARRPSMAAVSAQLSSSTPSSAATSPAQTSPMPPVPRAEATRVLPAAGPPAGTTVQRPVVPSPPPSAPPSSPTAPAQPRRRILPAIILVALAVLLVIGLAFAFLGLPERGAPVASPSAQTSRSQQEEPAPSPTVSSTRPSTTAPAPTAPSAPQAPSASPTSEATDAQLVEAVTGYYGLLPDDTDTAWLRLTASYQRQTGGRDSYEDFWNDLDSVTVSGARVSGPNQVQATITYVAKSGNQESTERRSFQLVAEDGLLKINQSAVL